MDLLALVEETLQEILTILAQNLTFTDYALILLEKPT